VVATDALDVVALDVVAADVPSSSSPHDTSRTPVAVQATAHRTTRDDLRLRTIGLPPCLSAASIPDAELRQPTRTFPEVSVQGGEYLVIIQRGPRDRRHTERMKSSLGQITRNG
jgi:hypothetical protein